MYKYLLAQYCESFCKDYLLYSQSGKTYRGNRLINCQRLIDLF